MVPYRYSFFSVLKILSCTVPGTKVVAIFVIALLVWALKGPIRLLLFATSMDCNSAETTANILLEKLTW